MSPLEMDISTIDLEKFWSTVNKSGRSNPEIGNCWEWTGCRFKFGYGYFYLNRKSRKAHRVSWNLHHGEIPKGMLVCHKCDNPCCVRPSHLFIGTAQDNMDDKHNKGRQRYVKPYNQAKGTRVTLSKLNEEDVLEIRRLYVKGSKTHGTYQLAEIYNVYQSTIHQIVTRTTWKHI